MYFNTMYSGRRASLECGRSWVLAPAGQTKAASPLK